MPDLSVPSRRSQVVVSFDIDDLISDSPYIHQGGY